MSTVAISTDVANVIITGLREAHQHLASNVKKVFDTVMEKTASHRSAAMDKAATLLTHKFVASTTDVLHVIRVAVTVGSLGIISPTRLPVFFARVAKGIAMIYEASKPEGAQEKAFSQGGAEVRIGRLQALVNKVMTAKQQSVAKGAAVIAGAVLEAACLPIAVCTAAVDAVRLACKHNMINIKMPALPFTKTAAPAA